ncbi:hypothetical protein [Sphingobacterium detergens]|uniref:hypothetical protein n=1 Tax=Sphingobacterium detergens TaxID=1145106 RepID=UPI0011C48799|nr:hypothetical protein [Sphingobacterium detergens]
MKESETLCRKGIQRALGNEPYSAAQRFAAPHLEQELHCRIGTVFLRQEITESLPGQPGFRSGE